jgi:flagellar biosynthesis protein FliQ
MISRLPVAVIRILPVCTAIAIALAARRILPSGLGTIPRLLITAALVLLMLWLFAQLTRRIDRRRA